jgi:hypothetical protein
MDQIKEKRIPVASYVPPVLYEKIKEEAEQQKRSMAQVIEMILEKSLLADGKKKGASK